MIGAVALRHDRHVDEMLRLGEGRAAHGVRRGVEAAERKRVLFGDHLRR